MSRLVLWSPIVDGARYAQDLLRINVTTQLAVYREVRQDRVALVEAMKQGQTANVDGYEVGFAMYDGLTAVVAEGRTRDLSPVRRSSCSSIARPQAPAQTELTALAARYAAGDAGAGRRKSRSGRRSSASTTPRPTCSRPRSTGWHDMSERITPGHVRRIATACGWSACCTNRTPAGVATSPSCCSRRASRPVSRRIASTTRWRRRSTAQGFTVLRFDFYGLGDAEGEVPLRQLRDLYGSVALGRYVGDTRDALDWLARHARLRTLHRRRPVRRRAHGAPDRAAATRASPASRARAAGDARFGRSRSAPVHDRRPAHRPARPLLCRRRSIRKPGCGS